MSEPTLFVATPLHTHSVHLAWAAGMLKLRGHFAGRIDIRTNVSSLLPRNRDILTYCFLESNATHMLCVDSDIGFTPEHAEELLATGKDFVAGTYCKKQEDRGIPAGLTGVQDGKFLFQAEWVPAGFMLLSRACVERLFGAYRHLDYDAPPWGRICGLWSARPQAPNAGEDVSFCKRWRDIGGELWLHRGVVVEHWDGGVRYVPTADSKATIVTPGDAPAAATKAHPAFPGATIKMYGSLPVYIHEAA